MSQRGSASVLVVALLGVLVVVAAGLAGVGRAVAAQTQATAAADAAALAAAPLTFLAGDPRAEAALYAKVNGGRLVSCRCARDGSFRLRVVTVEVAMDVDLGILGSHTVHARSAAEFDPLDLIAGG